MAIFHRLASFCISLLHFIIPTNIVIAIQRESGRSIPDFVHTPCQYLIYTSIALYSFSCFLHKKRTDRPFFFPSEALAHFGDPESSIALLVRALSNGLYIPPVYRNKTFNAGGNGRKHFRKLWEKTFFFCGRHCRRGNLSLTPVRSLCGLASFPFTSFTQ